MGEAELLRRCAPEERWSHVWAFVHDAESAKLNLEGATIRWNLGSFRSESVQVAARVCAGTGHPSSAEVAVERLRGLHTDVALSCAENGDPPFGDLGLDCVLAIGSSN